MPRALKAYLHPWLGFAALYGSQFLIAILTLVVCAVSPGFAYWIMNPWGVFCVTAVGGVVALGVVYGFLRSRSAGEFFCELGLRFPPRDIRVWLVALGVALGLAGYFLGSLVLTGAAGNPVAWRPFANGSYEGAYLFAIGLVGGPFLEELVMRGFLYQGFRKAYGLPVSVAALVLIATLTHGRSATGSVWWFLFFALLQVTICLTFEWTRNLWNCIAIHVAYNAVIAYFFLKAVLP